MCLQVNIARKCKCVSALLPTLQRLTERHRTCGDDDVTCTAQVFANETSIKLEEECECQRACSDLMYNRDVTLATLREEETGPSKKEGPQARLVLYFDSLTYDHVRSVPKYDDTGVLSNVGGINGMYLGLSFFVLFQVLDIIVTGALQLKAKLRHNARATRRLATALRRTEQAYFDSG
ncbi:acid-sensing ion channel 4-A-like [Haemaphysalis longicornis]